MITIDVIAVPTRVPATPSFEVNRAATTEAHPAATMLVVLTTLCFCLSS